MAKLRGLLELMDEALNMDAAYEGVRRLGLQADNTAADRAKALGFDDKTYYHGTKKSFDNFNIDKSSEYGSDAIFVSPNANMANTFAGNVRNLSPEFEKIAKEKGILPAPNILPLKIKSKNIFNFDNPKDIKKIQTSLNKTFKNELDLKKEMFIRAKILDGKLQKPKNFEDGFKWDYIKEGNWKDIENPNIQKAIKDNNFDGFTVKENPRYNDWKDIGIYNPANIRSKFAKFNPKYAGIGAGSVMSADLLANENSLLSSPDRNSILGYMADSYKYMADEGGLLGNILYSGGGKALDNLSYGTTPMKKGSGRLPSTPTNESLLNLMELFQL